MPPDSASPSPGSSGGQWCGWHTDHGALTGLVSAMYTNENGKEVGCGDAQAGLYARNRNGK